MNVGRDSGNLLLHFNPRFDCHGDVNTIVCNSKQDGVWGEEDRKADFPFQQGDKIEVRPQGGVCVKLLTSSDWVPLVPSLQKPAAGLGQSHQLPPLHGSGQAGG